jgi:hypothetical protein
MTEKEERRKHKRFQVRQGVLVGLAHSSVQVGPVVDISMGGLAFHYVGKKQPTNGSHLSLFSADDHFYLGNIKFKTVYDSVVAGEPDSECMRRCGVEFMGMDKNQELLLEDCILLNAIGEA